MFHRNTPKSETNKIEPQQQVEPEQQSFPYQAKVIEQTAVERYARSEAAQPATKVPPANQSAPLTDNQFYVYESSQYQEEKDTQIMTPADETKNEAKNEAPSRIDIPGGGVFSRPGQSPMAGRGVPGAYPGAYNATSSTPYGATATANDPASGRKLYIGQGITLSGEIEACDHLVVEGTVEAALKGASVLEIAEAGAYFGTVDIDEATIAGRFEGDLTVRGRLTIKASGSLKGSVSYKELAIEAGANVEGQVTPLDAKSAAATNTRGKINRTKPTDFGAELPFEGKAVAAE